MVRARVPESGRQEFDPTPQGSHPARLYRILDVGTQKVEYAGEVKHKRQVMLSWELVETKMADGRPFTAHKTFTNSLHEKAALRQLLEAWRAKKFSDAELADFDLDVLIGKPCLVNITHSQRGEQTFANVSSVMSVPGRMEVAELQNAPVIFDLEAPDWQVFASLSQKMQTKIAASPEYRAAQAGESAPVEDTGDDDGIAF